METDLLYLDNLDEYINDENRIVTYKWLSRSLQVHVNLAKQMLYAFVQQQRNVKDNDKIYVTYLLAGNTEAGTGNKVHKVCIVPEENLEATKTQMSPVTSCHIYSVQKTALKDADCLYTADYDCLQEHLLNSNRFSATKCMASKRRTVEELDNLRQGPSEAYEHPAQIKTAPSNHSRGSKGGKAQAGISSMFANASKKAVEKQTEKKPVELVSKQEAKAAQSKPPKKTPPGVMSFFAKQASKPHKKTEEPSEETAKAKTSAQKPCEETTKETTVENKEKQSQGKPSSRSRGKSKKDTDSDEDGRGKKTKRRRIKAVVSESSSSEDEVDIEELPPSPPREPSPEIPPVTLVEDSEEEMEEECKKKSEDEVKPVQSHTAVSQSGQKGRKRQRKKVPKTYIDEDGFMVTEKVWESESCSDDSDVPEVIKQTSDAAPPAKAKPEVNTKPEQKGKKKMVSPTNKQSGKQTSLMNFFKKK